MAAEDFATIWAALSAPRPSSPKTDCVCDRTIASGVSVEIHLGFNDLKVIDVAEFDQSAQRRSATVFDFPRSLGGRKASPELNLQILQKTICVKQFARSVLFGAVFT